MIKKYSRQIRPMVETADPEGASLLRLKGLYVTTHRLTALHIIRQNSPVAQAKLLQILASYGVSTATAYKTIYTLLNAKIIRHTIVGGTLSFSLIKPIGNYQVFLSCNACRQQAISRNQKAIRKIRQLLSGQGYELQSFDLHAHGTCNNCRTNTNPQQH